MINFISTDNKLWPSSDDDSDMDLDELEGNTEDPNEELTLEEKKEKAKEVTCGR